MVGLTVVLQYVLEQLVLGLPQRQPRLERFGKGALPPVLSFVEKIEFSDEPPLRLRLARDRLHLLEKDQELERRILVRLGRFDE